MWFDRISKPLQYPPTRDDASSCERLYIYSLVVTNMRDDVIAGYISN